MDTRKIQRAASRSKQLVLVILMLGWLAQGLLPRQAQAQTGPLCFSVPSITNCIEGRFRQYWEQNGGLPVFGYPITAAREEVNPETGKTYLTQWFERNRFELHPEIPPPYDVLLGRLGDDRLKQQHRDWRAFPPGQMQPGCLWFAETRHSVCAAFKGYWENHGLRDPGLNRFAQALALFGLPLSEPQMETSTNGEQFLTQWFERARFELHPNNPPAFQVLLGLLGDELRPPTPLPASMCLNLQTLPPQQFPGPTFSLGGLTFTNPRDQNGQPEPLELVDRPEDRDGKPELNVGFSQDQGGFRPLFVDFPAATFPNGVTEASVELQHFARATILALDNAGKVLDTVPQPNSKTRAFLTLHGPGIHRLQLNIVETLVYSICWVP
jgi:hypothetical protein